MSRASHKLLTRDEEQGLATRIQAGCQSALHELVLHNERLANTMARDWIARKITPSVDHDDIHQDCRLFLLEAARRFQPGRSGFASYACAFIAGRLLDKQDADLSDHLHYAAHSPSGLPPDTPLPASEDEAGTLVDALDYLPTLHRSVVVYHLGLGGEAELSFSEIDRRLCLQRGASFRLYHAALGQMRNHYSYYRAEGERRSAA